MAQGLTPEHRLTPALGLVKTSFVEYRSISKRDLLTLIGYAIRPLRVSEVINGEIIHRQIRGEVQCVCGGHGPVHAIQHKEDCIIPNLLTIIISPEKDPLVEELSISDLKIKILVRELSKYITLEDGGYSFEDGSFYTPAD
jgi:hypothetical protein